MDHATVNPKDLDSPCRELSDGSLGFVVAFLVRPGIDLLCVSTEVQSSCSSRIKRSERISSFSFSIKIKYQN